MNANGELYIATTLDRICDEFESEIRRGRHPKVNNYVYRVGKHLRPALRNELQCILHEYRTRAQTDVLGDTQSQVNNVSNDNLPNLAGRYHLLRRIGKGAFGQVFLATDRHLDRQVAIKIPREDQLNRQSHPFGNEAQ